MPRIVLTFSLILACQFTFAQDVWNILADVKFPTSVSEQRKGIYGIPAFGESVQAQEGKTITITGYMLPLTIDNQKFILSQYPFSECFFCGGAGKETVIELQIKKKEDFPIDEPIKIQGRLELIPSPHELCYRLVDAEWVR
ncbi:MAG: hypothetical protein MRZ79_20695 [Bacteroidia bacterium]|nr:hypothetical protein [Bacteroidia bacterium]